VMESKASLVKRISDGQGVMEHNTLVLLLDLIDQVETFFPIVEIGVFQGNTTRIMATYLEMTGKSNAVIGIDPFELFEDTRPKEERRIWPIGHGSYEKAKGNIAELMNVHLIQGFSHEEEVQEQILEASIILLDGDHTEEAVTRDLIAWLPKAKEFFVVHDESYPSVRKALYNLGIDYTR
jgi:hypothetical protein